MEDLYSDENPPPTQYTGRMQLGDVFAFGGVIFVALALFGSGLYLWVNQ